MQCRGTPVVDATHMRRVRPTLWSRGTCVTTNTYGSTQEYVRAQECVKMSACVLKIEQRQKATVPYFKPVQTTRSLNVQVFDTTKNTEHRLSTSMGCIACTMLARTSSNTGKRERGVLNYARTAPTNLAFVFHRQGSTINTTINAVMLA